MHDLEPKANAHAYALATLAQIEDALEAHPRSEPLPARLADALMGAMQAARRTGDDLIRAAE